MVNKVKRVYWSYRRQGPKAALGEILLSRNWSGDLLWSINDYRRVFGRYPNLLAPKRLSEHLLRLKLSRDGRSPLRTMISDKELVKDYITSKLGIGFTLKTLAVLRSKREALEFDYPHTCVVKPSHMSAEVILRHNAEQPPDLHQIALWFEKNYYVYEREFNYRNLQPKVIVEELLIEPGQHTPRDYKVFCFSGKPKFIEVDADRFSGHRRSFYSPDWHLLEFELQYPGLPEPLPRPVKLGEMLDAARRLASDFTFIRVDFYLVGSSVLVGELTNISHGARTRFRPDNIDALLGRLWREPDLDIRELFN